MTTQNNGTNDPNGPGWSIDQLRKCVIAQADDNDYSESGYVVCRIGDVAAVYHYSHCSCYGTWTCLSGGGLGGVMSPAAVPTPEWHGSWSELVRMAKDGECLQIPGRRISPDDYDAFHLLACYRQIVELDAAFNTKAQQPDAAGGGA